MCGDGEARWTRIVGVVMEGKRWHGEVGEGSGRHFEAVDGGGGLVRSETGKV